ncbi:hypothetical protein GE09DRAFT_1016737 [Coniochaeta sp. 2T2.1]|nr:hypothetical protein GE09DRAFT_1016737 [Coniochaeta sp. 2T2.1]
MDTAADPTQELEATNEDGYASEEDISDSSSTEARPPTPVAMAARGYQLEMLEESLKGNIIVAMDTGSGKTQVAVLRIQAELDQSPERIWFVAPTVFLVDQQLERIAEQIPHIICKRLCGDDNVDTWSSQKTWDSLLENVRTVVSTPDVLLDALKHGFVSLSSLSLIVFDEAHNCKGRNPGARIMREFYRPAKEKGLKVPHILGLTASPIISSSKEDLDLLESTLDARCRAPKRHREELLSHVKVPDMSVVNYGPPVSTGRTSTPSMTSLFSVFNNLDITQDPKILRLRARKTERSRLELHERIEKHDTPVFEMMKSFCRSSMAIMQKLGPWAADFYVHEVVSEFLSANFTRGDASDVSDDTRFLSSIFRSINAPVPPSTPTEVSRKLQKLINTLDSYEGDLTGIVFAEERTTVVVMTQLLLRHPTTRGRFRVASVVGNSRYRLRKQSLLELGNSDAQEALQGFRRGRVNLLVATTVLEEGIDMPACNIVICFEKPKTLKSFIQRRGRARMNASKLILLLDDQSTADAEEWREMELEMKKKYEDESRQIQIINEVEESEYPDYPPLEVEGKDGKLARLTIDDAKSHLEHFCATLSSRKYVDFTPYYTIDTVGDVTDPLNPSALIRATVHLPVSLPPLLRRAEGRHAWKSELNAKKDAAFQAYLALYNAGMLNDHLLPLRQTDIFPEIETRPSMKTVREQLDPWPMVAKAWDRSWPVSSRVLKFSNNDDATEKAEFDLLLPVQTPRLPLLSLYWDANSSWTVAMAESTDPRHLQRLPTSPPRNDMETLVALAYGHRGERYAVTDKRHMLCMVSRNHELLPDCIGAGAFVPSHFDNHPKNRLVRDTASFNHPYFYVGWLPFKPPADLVMRPLDKYELLPEHVPYVVVSNWPKKTLAFSRPMPNPRPAITKPYPRVLPATGVTTDTVPSIYARFAMAVPSLVHALEIYFVASELQTQRLEQLQLTDLDMVATAICTPGARMPMNYERIEFLGDCILKLSATSNALAHHPDWPEGLLSVMKDAFVSNSRLARACVDFGLDRYIINKPPTQEKWKPLYVEDHLPPESSGPFVDATRQLSTKILADVVEALIGVAYLSGGLPKSLECISLFLPSGKWLGHDLAREALYSAAPTDSPLPPAMQPLETLIGYTFTRKSLLVEAMTHSSYRVPGTHACLERLEFFGDSILDYLVVRRIFRVAHPKPLTNWEMHLLRTVLVNADFLAFRVMEWGVEVPGNDIVSSSSSPDLSSSSSGEDGASVTIEPVATRLCLWNFMRHSHADLAQAQRATGKRHAALRDEINAAMGGGDRYPWALLARLQAQKYYSDVFESLLGAVYVDSGSFEACDGILERAGVTTYLDRALGEGVKLWHPKEELGKLAVSDKVDYQVESRVKVEEEGDLGGGRAVEVMEFTCRVLVGDRVVAEVGEGVNREEVRTRAAEEAIRYYEGRGGRW